MTSHLKLFIIRNFTRNKEEKNSLEIEWSYQKLAHAW